MKKVSKENHILATVLEKAAEKIRKRHLHLRIEKDIDDGDPVIFPSDKLLSAMIKVTNADVEYEENYMNEAKFLLTQSYIGYAPDFYLFEAEEALDNYTIWQDDTVAVSPKNIANFALWLQQSDNFLERMSDAIRDELENFLENEEDIDRVEDEDDE